MDLRSIIGFLSEWMGAVAVVWMIAVSPRFQRPQVGFKYPRREGIVSLSITALITVVALIYFGVNPPRFAPNELPAPAPVIELSQALLLAGVALIPVIVALAARGQPILSAGWSRPMTRSGLMFGLALAMLTIILRNRASDLLNGLSGDNLLALVMALGVALAEETVFRGYIQPRMVSWLGAWPGVLTSAALFTIWHMAALITRLPVETTLLNMALTFIQGIILGWIMYRSHHVLAPALYRAISIWVRWL